MFWSDLGPDVGFEGIGLIDPSLQTVAVFAKPGKLDRKASNLDEKVVVAGAESEGDEGDKKGGEKPKDKDKDCKEKLEKKIEKKSEGGDTAEYGKGVIFYLKNDKVVGILLWNIFNRIGLARTIINENKTYDDLNEVAKLFAIHS